MRILEQSNDGPLEICCKFVDDAINNTSPNEVFEQKITQLQLMNQLNE